jgi:radical SAM protein with 4Fe4S-binding SPASM domain
MDRVRERAFAARVPLAVHFDLTYRCNERCEHCYLDHEDHGELTTTEVEQVLDQLAACGTLFVIFSGGELLLRKDFFHLLGYARRLAFDVKLKTNGMLIGAPEARRIRDLGVRQVQISVYSHRPEVHDAITKVPGSLRRTLAAIALLRDAGLKVTIANVLMRHNAADYESVRALASQLGAEYTLDPTITPKLNGDRSVLALQMAAPQTLRVFRNRALVGDDFYHRPTADADPDVLDGLPCSAGHIACYISPYGEVYPCVQFPLVSGNLRAQRFADVWQHSPQLNEVRGIRTRDLPTCSSCGFVSSCTRCPGLAYMEGNMRGPSAADCEKSLLRAAAGETVHEPSTSLS